MNDFYNRIPQSTPPFAPQVHEVAPTSVTAEAAALLADKGHDGDRLRENLLRSIRTIDTIAIASSACSASSRTKQ